MNNIFCIVLSSNHRPTLIIVWTFVKRLQISVYATKESCEDCKSVLSFGAVSGNVSVLQHVQNSPEKKPSVIEAMLSLSRHTLNDRSK